MRWERVLAVLLGLAFPGGTLSRGRAAEPVEAGPPASAPAAPAAAEDAAAEDAVAGAEMFHDSLAPHGRWVWVEPHGRVWIPAGMAPAWRPYTCGHWVYTDEYGWTWVSDFEDWGPVCYHYGRWGHSPLYGWYWVPGTVWAPAWVAWRCGGGYVGWAPLPPGVVVHTHLEFGVRHVDVVAIDPVHWAFVSERRILAPRVVEHVVPVNRNATIVAEARNVTRLQVSSSRIVNRSLEVERVEKATGGPVQRYRVVEDSSAAARRGAVAGNQLAVYRPDRTRRPAGGSTGTGTGAARGAAAAEPGAGAARTPRTEVPPGPSAGAPAPGRPMAPGAGGATPPSGGSPPSPAARPPASRRAPPGYPGEESPPGGNGRGRGHSRSRR